MALANANLADVVREGLQDGLITFGLQANCNVIASTPSFNLDPGGVSRKAALNLIEGSIRGVQAR